MAELVAPRAISGFLTRAAGIVARRGTADALLRVRTFSFTLTDVDMRLGAC